MGRLSAFKSDRHVEYTGKQIRVDILREELDLYDREIDGENFPNWTKKLTVLNFSDRDVIIAEEVFDDEANSVKYHVTYKVSGPEVHTIIGYD